MVYYYISALTNLCNHIKLTSLGVQLSTCLIKVIIYNLREMIFISIYLILSNTTR